MRTILRLTGFFALASILIAASMIAYDYFQTRNAFPPNTFIYNVDVSTLTRREARNKLKEIPLHELYAPYLSFEAEGKYYPFRPEKLGVYLMVDETVNNAFKTTHRHGYFKDLKKRISSGTINAPLVLGIDDKRLAAAIKNLATKIETEPKNASIEIFEESGGYYIDPHIPGRKIELEKSRMLFKSSFYQGKRVIPLVIQYSYPDILENDLRDHPPAYLLSSYTTYYGKHDSPNRIHNIRLISSWIDGKLLMPEEVFSLAEVLGDVEPYQGFKEALVIMGDELVPLYGGGACQVATTLYNATSLADIKILQRRNHSFYFNIYPLGRDATVYTPSVDFKFQNDTGYPLLIKTEATSRKLSVKLYGTPSGKRVSFSGVAIRGKNDSGEYEPMSLKKVIDEDLPFRTTLVRRVYDKAGNKIKEEEIKSYYKMYGDKSNVPIRRPEPR